MDKRHFEDFWWFVRVKHAANENLGVSLICKGKKPAAGEKFEHFFLKNVICKGKKPAAGEKFGGIFALKGDL